MSRGSFTAIKTEGGLLPREILERVAAEDDDLPGLDPVDYHLQPSERLGEAINRSWNRLLGLWEAYTEELQKRPEGDAATGLTRDRWLLPLFEELKYGRLQRSTAVEIEGKSFAISHAWEKAPIHLVGAGVSIDKRSAGVAGAAAAAPHSLVQEYLNRSDKHLWAFVSNGRLLRILRDNHSLSRQAYVEFDLEAILEGELFSDFRILWLVCHQSRVEGSEPEEYILEKWFQQSREEGVRALDALRDGVEKAIEAFGAGLLRHPANGRLHEGLRSGELDRQEYYRELLRLVYRLIFLFVAEDRDALLNPQASPASRERYKQYYASNRLRDLAGRRRGSAHDDLWRGLRLVLSKLHNGSPELGLPGLGSYLWREEAVEWIGDAELRNDDLLTALRALCYTTQDHQLLPVNWRTMGSEELGSVYESLLELHPQMNREAGTFELSTAAGHERKTTGSYYTPTSLVDRLLDSALEPVLEEAMRAENREEALLDLKVCDTAAGSGHFLVAAARRIALRLASVRTGDKEASPEAVTEALRDVVGRCIYGVDLNPLAVELCKVSLWMEALEPGKPLSFLDHHIQVGNSLLGTTPALLRKGIPDDALKEIEGDDREIVTTLRNRNREERESEQIGFHTQMVAEPKARYGAIETILADLNRADDSTLEAVREKEAGYKRLLDDRRYQAARLVADSWCAAFVWRKTEEAPPAVTEDVFRHIERAPAGVPAAITVEVRRLAKRYRFFHFHLAFPDVFRASDGSSDDGGVTGWPGGFHVVLGNPPWDLMELKEQEFFAAPRPDISSASTGAARKRLIAELEDEDPELYQRFIDEKRVVDGSRALVRESGRYPLCGRGRVNTYSVFAETNRQILGPRGRLGIIVPSGIATDATTQYFFRDLMESESLVSLYDFENREKLFPAVDSRVKFCLMTVAGGAHEHDTGAEFAFFLQSPKELDEPDKRFVLSNDDVELLNPNTRTCPIFRTRRDAEVTKQIYRAVPVLVREGDPEGDPWGLTIRRVFNMGIPAIVDACLPDSDPEVGSREDLLPMYEAKLVHQFDHRFATYRRGEATDLLTEEKIDPGETIHPRFWIPEANVRDKLAGLWDRQWLLYWRDITNATNERTAIAGVAPYAGSDFTLRVGFPSGDAAKAAVALVASFNSFAFDYCARQMLGGTHLSDYITKQLPVLSPAIMDSPAPWTVEETVGEWLMPRVLELVYTATDLGAFAEDAGYSGPPFQWDDERRFRIRAEIDAAFFHLYGLDDGDAAYVLDGFPIVQRNDEAAHGEYRTKRLILEVHRDMADAARIGRTYRTRLDPPPADPSVAHPNHAVAEGRS